MHGVQLGELETMSHSTSQALLDNEEVRGVSFMYPTLVPNMRVVLNLVEKHTKIKCKPRAERTKIP